MDEPHFCGVVTETFVISDRDGSQKSPLTMIEGRDVASSGTAKVWESLAKRGAGIYMEASQHCSAASAANTYVSMGPVCRGAAVRNRDASRGGPISMKLSHAGCQPCQPRATITKFITMIGSSHLTTNH